MARAATLSVLDEGVETGDVPKFQPSTSCDETQGYFLARPLTEKRSKRAFRLNRRRIKIKQIVVTIYMYASLDSYWSNAFSTAGTNAGSYGQS
jgi:hypothetical protein